LINHITSYKQISTRVATIDFTIPTRNGSLTKFRMINAYGPTSKIAKENPMFLENFYSERQSACATPARWLNFICGDLNSKIGKLSQVDSGLKACMAPAIGIPMVTLF